MSRHMKPPTFTISPMPHPPPTTQETDPNAIAAANLLAKTQPLPKSSQFNPDDPDGDGGIKRSMVTSPLYIGLNNQPTRVIPRAMAGMRVEDLKGPIEFQPIVSTQEQEEELLFLDLDRNHCAQEALFTWAGHKYTPVGGLIGGFFSILAPNHWPRWGRFFPYCVGLGVGVMVDRVRRGLACRQKHPVPNWYIENALPVTQTNSIRRAQFGELEQAIREVQEKDQMEHLKAATATPKK